MGSFYVICMKNRNDDIIYLGEDDNSDSNCKWVFDFNEAIWFETENLAEAFANKYFKNFDRWFIKEIE